jgi:hypothetical protein
MLNEDDNVKQLYDKYSKNPIFYYLNSIIGQTTEKSVYRKESIDLLSLNSKNVTYITMENSLELIFQQSL